MTIKYLKKASKTASTDDTKTKEIVQNLLKELEKSKEEGCKELTKKFDKYDGEIIVSNEKIEDIKKKLDQKTKDDIRFSYDRVKKFAEASRVPVINAGDGSNEHPSQALLDLYTIQKELSQNNKSIDGLRIALVGDLKFGRAVHSLCKILSLYDDVKMNLISPEELKLPIKLVESISAKGVTITETENLEDGISEVDIIYVTRVQEERFKNKQDADKYRGLLSLNQSIYTANCEPNTVIMHPLPRDSRSDANELDSDLYENPNLAIFRQADNGIVIRMAIFTLVLDIEEKIDQSSMPVNWKVGLKN